jgi:hypothetical protein
MSSTIVTVYNETPKEVSVTIYDHDGNVVLAEGICGGKGEHRKWVSDKFEYGTTFKVKADVNGHHESYLYTHNEGRAVYLRLDVKGVIYWSADFDHGPHNKEHGFHVKTFGLV